MAKVLIWKVIWSSPTSLLISHVTLDKSPVWVDLFTQLLTSNEIAYLKILWKLVKEYMQMQGHRESKNSRKRPLFSSSFIHLFIQPVFIELQELCGRWDTVGNMRDKIPALTEIISQPSGDVHWLNHHLAKYPNTMWKILWKGATQRIWPAQDGKATWRKQHYCWGLEVRMDGPMEEEWTNLSRQRTICKDPAVGLGSQAQAPRKGSVWLQHSGTMWDRSWRNGQIV